MKKRNLPSIRFEKEQLDDLVQAENSCVEIKEQNYHLALHPFHLTYINESIKGILNKGIARYDKKLDGILLGYQNIKLLSQLGTISYDSFFIHIDIVASFYVFKPEVGKVLHGIVNKKSEDHIGCLVHNTFNVSLPKPEDDEEWSKVELKSEILFRITCIDLDGRLPYIRGELVSRISEDDSGFSTSEENPSGKPRKIIFQSDDEQEVDVSESKKKKKDKRKKNIEPEVDDEQQTKKRKRKHSTVDFEEENTKSSKKKKSKHKDNDNPEVINETNIEDNERRSKKKKKHKHKEELHEEEVHNLETNVNLDDERKKKKKSKKHNVKYELEDASLEYHSKKKVKQERKDSLEELTDAVLERTLRDVSEDVKTESKREKVKKHKIEVNENDELDTTLPELDLEMLFETDDKTKLIIDNKFVMADDEDKRMKNRRSSFASNGLENKADLLADSDLEKIYKDVDKSKQEKISVKKRRRSTSSDDFQTQKKKKKKIQ